MRGKLWVICGVVFGLAMMATSNAIAYDCRTPDSRVERAIKEATERGKIGGAAEAYCGTVNIDRAVIWKLLQCINNDTTLSAEHIRLMSEQLAKAREHKKNTMQGFNALTGSGVTCECWSSICAD